MDVTLLTYIESSGSQWINTGLTPANPVVEAVVSDVSGSSTQGTAYLFGVYQGSGSGNFGVGIAGESGNVVSYVFGSAGNVKSSIVFANPSTIRMTTSQLTQNSQTVANISGTYKAGTQTFSIFGAMRNGSPYNISRLLGMKLHSFKLYDGNTLLLDLVPAKRNSDNAIGLYDQLNDEFYENESSTPFIPGDPIIPPAEKVANKIILADGTVLLDLTGDDVTASDVVSGKKFHLATGHQATGTGASVSVTPLSVTENGTYTAPSGTAYSPITVNVSGGRLPAEYQEVEWIRSSGTQNITVAYTSALAFTAIYDGYFNTTSSRVLVGLNGNAGCYFGKTTSNILELWSSNTINVNPTSRRKIYFWHDGSKAYLNSNSLSTQRSGTLSTGNWNVFGISGYMGAGLTLYEVVIISGGGIKAYLIPCKRKSDNVIGMYDIYNGSFKTNTGSGTFTCGGNV